MIKVGMDISQTAHIGGVSIYTANLASELVKIPDLQMKFFYSSLRKSYQGKLKDVKRFKFPPTFFEWMFDVLRFPEIEKFLGPIDLFHSSDWIQPKTKAKKVTTYHDLSPILYPQWSHPKIVAVNKRRLKIVEEEIDHVIAVSESTKRDLLLVSNIPSEKITVVYEGLDKNFKPQKDSDLGKFRQRHDLPDKFILAIGGVGERKNLARVKQAAKGYDLVITHETIPDISYEELPLLYASATLLLYPSLYEGFGLPVLEAMSVGTPVITSNVSSLPEVGGGAAVYVDPDNLNQITRTLKRVWEDQSEQQVMIKNGFEQSKRFSWEKCAKQTAQVYRKVVHENLD